MESGKLFLLFISIVTLLSIISLSRNQGKLVPMICVERYISSNLSKI